MRRTVLLAVLVLAGCGGSDPEPIAPARSAEPQRATLGWRESYPPAGERLLFAVDELDVRADGWSVMVAVTNRTKVPFDLGDSDAELDFGLMLFATGDLSEVEDAARRGALPTVRRATSLEPSPPDELAPGATWRTTLSASGPLSDGSYLRVTFGPLTAKGDPPDEMEPVVFWITDHAHKL